MGDSKLSKVCGLGPAGFPTDHPNRRRFGGFLFPTNLLCRQQQGWITT